MIKGSPVFKNSPDIQRLLTIGSAAMDVFDLENFPYLIAVFDSEAECFVAISKSSLSILGYHPDEMTAVPYYEFLYNREEHVKSSIEVRKNIRNNTNSYKFRNSYRHRDGSKVNLIWSAGQMKTDQVFCIAEVEDE